MLRRLFLGLGAALFASALALPAAAQYGGGYGGGYHDSGGYEPPGKAGRANSRREESKGKCTRQKFRTRDETGGYRDEWRVVCD